VARSMPLNNVATTDGYSEAATIERRAIYRLRLQVTTAAIFYQLADPSTWPGINWGPEKMLVPSSYGLLVADRCSGVRVRSAAAGQPARVNIDFDTDDAGGAT
jgi:hypothetical protein